MPRLESAFAWSFDIRRIPVATWYSGVRFWPSIAHSPPPRRTDRSRIVGVPRSIANRARNSDVPWPFHDTVSRSPSSAVVRPVLALYSVRLQFSGAAACFAATTSDDDIGEIVSAAATAATAPSDTTRFLLLIYLPPEPNSPELRALST